jgi:hypothetical protein
MTTATEKRAGMVAPVVTGYLVQPTGHYSLALLVSAVVGLIGLAAWLIVLPTVRPIDGSAMSVSRGQYRPDSQCAPIGPPRHKRSFARCV